LEPGCTKRTHLFRPGGVCHAASPAPRTAASPLPARAHTPHGTPYIYRRKSEKPGSTLIDLAKYCNPSVLFPCLHVYAVHHIATESQPPGISFSTQRRFEPSPHATIPRASRRKGNPLITSTEQGGPFLHAGWQAPPQTAGPAGSAPPRGPLRGVCLGRDSEVPRNRTVKVIPQTFHQIGTGTALPLNNHPEHSFGACTMFFKAFLDIEKTTYLICVITYFYNSAIIRGQCIL